MTDLFDQEVLEGDIVGFNPPNLKGLRKGIVLSTKNKTCRIEYYKHDGDSAPMVCSRNQVVVMGKIRFPEFYL